MKPEPLTSLPRGTHSTRAEGQGIQRGAIPLAAKIAYTAFVTILVPVYLHEYGATNFLWFCDCALLITGVGMWCESSLLVSLCSVGILIPQCLWLLDFGSHFLGLHGTGMTDYMFDRKIPLFIRSLSLFHGWLPVALVWLLGRLGYDKRGLPAWTILALALLLACYFFTPPPIAHPADPNTPTNINYVYGFSDKSPQHWVNPKLYVFLWTGALWLTAYFPTHLALRKIFRPAVH